MALVIHIETWKSRSGRKKAVLFQRGDGCYAYKGTRCSGVIGMLDQGVAVQDFREKIRLGVFDSVPMRVVDTGMRAVDEVCL